MGAPKIDINVDIGEGFPFDRELIRFATSANVCCGVHAGSAELTEETVATCREVKIKIGCHPGYPDRESMGRRTLPEGKEREYLDSVVAQIRGFYRYEPAYIKPHGAFYNDTAVILPPGWDAPKFANPPVDGAGLFLARTPGLQMLGMMLRVYRVPLMGRAGTAHAEVARRAGQSLIREGFADRATEPDGRLRDRSLPGAVLTEIRDIRKNVLTLAGHVDSICIHGDSPDALPVAQAVYAALKDAGFEVSAAC